MGQTPSTPTKSSLSLEMALMKTLVLCLAVTHLLLSEAREFHVLDDKASWQIPSSPDAFDKWAQKNRFEIGDSIVLKYDGKVDSVLEVSEADYKSCTKSNPTKSHSDGNTVIALDRPGSFFFISGADGHCEKGQKLQMRVLAAHHHHHSTPAPAPAPFATKNGHHHPHHSPAPAPAPAHHSGGLALRGGAVVVAAAAIVAALV